MNKHEMRRETRYVAPRSHRSRSNGKGNQLLIALILLLTAALAVFLILTGGTGQK